MKGKLIFRFLVILTGVLYLNACDKSVNQGIEEPAAELLVDEPVEEPTDPFAELVPVSGASNATAIIKNESKNGWFQLHFTNIQPNEVIKNGKVKGWGLEWKKSLRSNSDLHDGVGLYIIQGSDKWKPLNYFFSIKKLLENEYHSLNNREVQAITWSLAGYMGIGPEFNLDKLSYDELPERLMKNGKPNFNREKVQAIVQRVKNDYPTAPDRLVNPDHSLVIALTEEGEQNVVMTPEECNPPPPPPVEVPGKDVVVFNDINIFDEGAMANSNNVLFVQNLVIFTTDGERNDGDVVWMDRGRDAQCYPPGNSECGDEGWGTMRSTITDAGFTLVDVFSTSGSITEIPDNVKIIFLIMPAVPYTVEEINLFKQFADEGGRIVFIGEWEGFYPPAGIDTENQFLIDMGAVLRNTGGAFDCGRQLLPGENIVDHPITQGMTEFSFACFSTIEPGPGDFVLMFGQDGETVMGGVAEIDPTPISVSKIAVKSTAKAVAPGLNKNSARGY